VKNCVNFKRKFGKSPIEDNIYGFVQSAKREWVLHKTTVGVFVAIVGLIVASVTFILKLVGMF
jgi:hypothetical protein